MLSILLPVNNPPARQNPTIDIVLSSHEIFGTIFDLAPNRPEDNLGNSLVIDYSLLGTNELVFTTAAGTENIATVTVDGQVYTLGYLPLEPGQFTYNPDTRTVVVKLLQPINSNTVVTYKNQNHLLPTTSYLLPTTSACNRLAPASFKRWNVNGSVTINKSFQGHSSLSFGFIACKDQYSLIEQQFSNGAIFTGFEQKWRVISHSITLKGGGNNSDELLVAIAAQDWLANYGTPSQSPLDRPLLLKLRTGTNSYQKRRSLSDFAQRAGVSYIGADIEIRVPKSTNYDDTTTLRQLLESRAITKHGFIHYSATGVELRPWGQTPIHVISEASLRSDITLDIKGHGSLEDGIKLATEYRNLKVNLEFDQDAADKKVGVTQRWVFENCQDLEDLYSPKEYYGFYYKQPNPDILRNPGINFDAGGRTKKATKITEVNGTVTFEQYYEAGYAFASNETHEVVVTAQGNYTLRLIPQLSAEPFWKEVKTTTTDYIYDRDGYLKTIKITGQEIARLQQESEKLEAINLQAQALLASSKVNGIITPDPSLTAQADAYKFSETLPIEDITNFTLEKHRDYFDDTVKPGDECDENFVEPKFVALKNRVAESYIIAANPKNTEQFTYPQIVNGKFLTETERNTITSNVFPFKFEHRQFAQNAEGEYAKNAIVLGTVTQNIGKPGTQSRLDKDIDPVKGNSSNYDRYKNSNYYLNSSGVTPAIRTSEGSKSYPDIDDPNTVKAIAETELSIINTQNSLTTNIDILPRKGIVTGDRILFQGKMWVMFDSSETLEVQQGYFNSSSQNLSLGRLLKPKLSLENRTGCSR